MTSEGWESSGSMGEWKKGSMVNEERRSRGK